MEVDWAGSTLVITDRAAGEKLEVYIFVATLPYSQYSYVEAFLDMKSSSWLTGHIHALEHFEGVPVFYNRFVHKIAKKSTQSCHPIFPLFKYLSLNKNMLVYL